MSETRWLDDEQMKAWRGLLTVVHRAFPEIERGFKAHDILGVHYHILVELSNAPDDTLQLCELAESANLSRSRLTHRLRYLIEEGCVAISDDLDDQRAKQATLTPAGWARLVEVAPHHVEDVQRTIFDPLTTAQTTALADAVHSIAESICCHPEYLNPRD